MMKYDINMKGVYGSSSLRMLLEIIDSWDFIPSFEEKLKILTYIRDTRIYPDKEKNAPTKKSSL